MVKGGMSSWGLILLLLYCQGEHIEAPATSAGAKIHDSCHVGKERPSTRTSEMAEGGKDPKVVNRTTETQETRDKAARVRAEINLLYDYNPAAEMVSELVEATGLPIEQIPAVMDLERDSQSAPSSLVPGNREQRRRHSTGEEPRKRDRSGSPGEIEGEKDKK